MDTAGRSIDLHQDREGEGGLAVLERALKCRAQCQSQFRQRPLGSGAAERPARGLEIAASMLGQMHNSMRPVDKDIGRRNRFERLPMKCSLAQRRPRAYGSSRLMAQMIIMGANSS